MLTDTDDEDSVESVPQRRLDLFLPQIPNLGRDRGGQSRYLDPGHCAQHARCDREALLDCFQPRSLSIAGRDGNRHAHHKAENDPDRGRCH